MVNAVRNDDDATVDRAFDEALAAMLDGSEPSWSDLAPDRPDLRPAIEAAIHLAREILPQSSTLSFGNYSIVRELGAGGMGAVYLARQDSLNGRLVALKVLPAWARLSAHARDRFRREAAIIASLNHPGIVRVHELVLQDSAWAYAMEWIEGPTLSQLIRRTADVHGDADRFLAVKSLLPEMVLRERPSWSRFIGVIGASVADALSAVHRAGVLHRDIKPSNILLRRNAEAMLSDFGVACPALNADHTRHTEPGEFIGTHAYAAPEQHEPDAVLTTRADIFALGATLYHALAGAPPRREPGVGAHAIPPLISQSHGVPRDLATIVDRCLEPDPERRYPSAEAVADDLRRFLEYRPILARPPHPIRRAALFVRRTRRVPTAVMLGSGVVVAALTVLLLFATVFPRIAASLESSARTLLLDEKQEWAIYDRYFFGETRQPFGMTRDARWRDDHHEWIARVDRMRSQLSRASMLRAWEGRLERQVVAVDAALAILAAADPTLKPITLPASLPPVARDYAEARMASDGNPTALVVPDGVISDADLRILGLVAVLSRDVEAARAAWSKVDLRREPDPFIDAWVGIAMLASGDPALASPRLHSAALALTPSHYVLVAAAEAAARCGDVLQAQRWLDDVEPSRRIGPLSGYARVQALVFARGGRLEEARALYARLLGPGWTLVFNRDYLEFALQSEDLPAAADQSVCGLTTCITDRYGPDSLYLLYDRALNAWWRSLSLQEQAHWLLRIATDPIAPEGTIYQDDPYAFTTRLPAALNTLMDECQRRGLRLEDGPDTLYASLLNAGLLDLR